jgi:hypothetical protein
MPYQLNWRFAPKWQLEMPKRNQKLAADAAV